MSMWRPLVQTCDTASMTLFFHSLAFRIPFSFNPICLSSLFSPSVLQISDSYLPWSFILVILCLLRWVFISVSLWWSISSSLSQYPWEARHGLPWRGQWVVLTLSPTLSDVRSHITKLECWELNILIVMYNGSWPANAIDGVSGIIPLELRR